MVSRVLLVVYDNDSFLPWFPLGLAYVASALRNAGHKVEVYSQDIFHWPDSHLTEYLTKNKFDVVGVGITAGYYQYRKLLKISEAINAVPKWNRPKYILGGHGPSPEPEFFMKKTGADAVCIGEADISVVNLMEALEGKQDMHDVKGIAFMENGECVKTPRQEVITDVDSLPFPAWDLFPMDYYTLLRQVHIKNNQKSFFMITGRGCPYRCNFCYRMDPGFRPRSAENIIKEMKYLKEHYGIDYFYFSDELLMSSEERSIDISQAIIDSKIGTPWLCNGRLNFAKLDVLKLMKEAGCLFINYGIECVDDQILKNMNKSLTVKEITEGIENTLKAGISPGFNIIFGNIDEDERTLQQSVDFLLKYDDGGQFRTIRPVTPYPGTDLYNLAIKKGMIKDVEDFYENKHINSDLLAVNFTKISDKRFHEVLFEANKKLIENYFENSKKRMVDTAKKLYFEKDASFRGFRHT